MALFTSHPALAREYASILVGGEHSSVVFTELAALLMIYFVSAAAAHIRARFTGQSFWVNCLGRLALSVAVLIFSFL